MEKIIAKIYSHFLLENLLTSLAENLLPNLTAACISAVVFYILWRIISKTLTATLGRLKLDETAQRFAQAIIKSIVVITGLLTILGQLGFNMASILGSLGVAGLTIGFAAKDALSNVISALFIFWDRPFVIGDLVEINGQYGRVADVTMRSTRIVTTDGKMLAIPNTVIINTTVAFYTNFPHLRLDIAITVGTGENLGHVRRLLLDIVKNNTQYLTDPAPVVVVTALNDYNVALELRVWIVEEQKHIAMKHELREKIFLTLRENKIDMPFETLQVSLSQSSDTPHSR
ncbi:MAG: mechanosensitive ion channel family protein [Proteobacteria bacterium]|nr:mechanosensitive ion channel family protein [Desulfobulbaceae bacterium]MBU4152465.1 mechanosensitive ion channel family protein [Pseudomonadota bacterium]MDP2104511.1 mechanosensitive ion channel family protein [Desulfobulbaceae bacterium]